jgi:preprotein translocase subunit SecB
MLIINDLKFGVSLVFGGIFNIKQASDEQILDFCPQICYTYKYS